MFHDFKIIYQKLQTSTLNDERMKIHRPRTLVKYPSTSIVCIYLVEVVFTLPDSNSLKLYEQIKIRKTISKYIQNLTICLHDIYLHSWPMNLILYH